MLKKFTLKTGKRDEMIEVTKQVQDFVIEQGLVDGAVIIYCPHTTAGITINENADPDVKLDMMRRFDEVYPWNHKTGSPHGRQYCCTYESKYSWCLTACYCF